VVKKNNIATGERELTEGPNLRNSGDVGTVENIGKNLPLVRDNVFQDRNIRPFLERHLKVEYLLKRVITYY